MTHVTREGVLDHRLDIKNGDLLDLQIPAFLTGILISAEGDQILQGGQRLLMILIESLDQVQDQLLLLGPEAEGRPRDQSFVN